MKLCCRPKAESVNIYLICSCRNGIKSQLKGLNLEK